LGPKPKPEFSGGLYEVFILHEILFLKKK